MTPTRWTLFAPWWARWLVCAAAAAAFFAAVPALMMPGFWSVTDWPWKAAVVAGSGLGLGAVMVYAQGPMRRAYLLTLDGLDRAQQDVAVKALRRGDAPADPAVLAGAIRAGALSATYSRGLKKSQKIWVWMPALYLVLAVLELLAHEPLKGLLWVGFAVYFASYSAWGSYRQQQLHRQVERLRTAAAGIPEAEAALADTRGGVPRPPRRRWATVIMLAVLLAYIAVTTYFWAIRTLSATSARARDCATVGQVVDVLNKRHEMLDSRRIVPGGLGLDTYQEWSDQLRALGQHATAPDLAPHLKRVGELSAHAVAIVRDLRQRPAPTNDIVQAHENDYTRTMSDLVYESGQATTACTSR